MLELIDELKYIKLAIFDLDGVVYRGDKLIPNAEKVIRELKEKSIEVVYNTNNSTITRQSFVEKLKKLGISSKLSNIYTSASITSAEITRIKKKAKIYVIGETGLREELKSLGHTIETNPTIYKDIDFVIVGLDRAFSYDRLAIAQKCILEGDSQFYATNMDPTLPVAIGFKPGAGVMVNAVTTCTDKKPIRVFGKPEPFGIKLILKDKKFSPEEACIFGDRLNTDILAGNRAEITSIAVLTGVSTKKMIIDLKKKVNETKDKDIKMLPDLVIDKLDDIFKEM